METFQPKEKHATLVFDEMNIKPGLQLDSGLSTVIGRPTLKSSNEAPNEFATHALVYMLAGVSTRWKQIVAYDFTGTSYNPLEIYERIKQIIYKAHEIGITVRAIVSDMGPQNRSLWKSLNIVAGKHSQINNSVVHPCLPNERLLVVPDPVHIFKNIASALTKGHSFILEDCIVEKYNLLHNKISIEPITEVYELDKNDVIRLCPRLKENVIRPSHFDKMNVGVSVALINNDVSAAILYYISLKKIDETHSTTAWFLQVMYKWFQLLTCRYPNLAISLKNKENHDENITFLKSVQEIMYHTKINNKWQPFQTGVLLATQSAMDFQKIYLEKEDFDFVMLGRLTQDCVENSFSIVRCRQPVPDAHLFKISLRLLCLSHLENNTKNSSYDRDGGNFVVRYCQQMHEKKNLMSKENIIITELQNEADFCSNLYEKLSEEVEASLYYLLGAVIFKIGNHYSVCETCFNSIQKKCNEVTTLNYFLKLKEFKVNCLQHPTIDLYNCIYNMELRFRASEDDIVNNRLSLDNFVNNVINIIGCPDTILNCHNIFEKTVKLFFKCRLYFLLNSKYKKDFSEEAHASRSMAMRVAVNK